MMIECEHFQRHANQHDHNNNIDTTKLSPFLWFDVGDEYNDDDVTTNPIILNQSFVL